MNENQKALFGNDFGLIYYPYEFEDAINHHCSYAYSDTQKKNISEMGKFWKYVEGAKTVWDGKSNTLEIKQLSQNQKGTLTFVGLGVEKISFSYKGKEETIKLVKSKFKGIMVGNVPIDFLKPIKNLKFHFRYDLADPYIMDISLIKYKIPEVDYEKLYIKNMDVSHGLGQDLINIYFSDARDDIEKTKVELYKTTGVNNSKLISSYNIEKGTNFLSIPNLAYGGYEYKVIQYVGGQPLVQTSKIAFKLSEPNYSGKPYISGR